MDTKAFEMREYNNTKPASSLIEKSFYMDDKKPLFSTDQEFKDTPKTLENKMFSPQKTDWRDSEKKQKLFDTERDLSKTYKGKIDINKRSTFDTDYLQNVYDEMQERSMQDINKYQFRRSHPTDPGIKTVRAGGDPDIKSKESFLDIFSSRKKIDINAPLASFKGNEQRNVPRVDLPSEPISGEAHPPSSMRAAERVIEKSRSNMGKVKQVEYLDESQSNKYEFLRVPQGMKPKGKAVIKIETDE